MAKGEADLTGQTELSWVTKMHLASRHHVVILEASMAENDKRRIFHMSKKLRLFRNGLVHEMQKRVEQLFRTKRYRKLSQALEEARGKLRRMPEHNTLMMQKRDIINEMKNMQYEYRLTWKDCREEARRLTPKYGVPSIFALTKAEDVWRSVGQQLAVGVGRYTPLKFRSRFDWVTIRAKQIERGIIVTLKNKRVWFRVEGLFFTYKDGDDYIRREMAMVEKYLANAAEIDRRALATFKATGEPMDTFQPSFVTIVPKEIRGRLRVFLHMSLEAAPLPRARATDPRDTDGQIGALAEARGRYEERRLQLQAKMMAARKACFAGMPMARKLHLLRVKYQDNKRNLRDTIKKNERLLAQSV